MNLPPFLAADSAPPRPVVRAAGARGDFSTTYLAAGHDGRGAESDTHEGSASRRATGPGQGAPYGSRESDAEGEFPDAGAVAAEAVVSDDRAAEQVELPDLREIPVTEPGLELLAQGKEGGASQSRSTSGTPEAVLTGARGGSAEPGSVSGPETLSAGYRGADVTWRLSVPAVIRQTGGVPPSGAAEEKSAKAVADGTTIRTNTAQSKGGPLVRGPEQGGVGLAPTAVAENGHNRGMHDFARGREVGSQSTQARLSASPGASPMDMVLPAPRPNNHALPPAETASGGDMHGERGGQIDVRKLGGEPDVQVGRGAGENRRADTPTHGPHRQSASARASSQIVGVPAPSLRHTAAASPTPRIDPRERAGSGTDAGVLRGTGPAGSARGTDGAQSAREVPSTETQGHQDRPQVTAALESKTRSQRPLVHGKTADGGLQPSTLNQSDARLDGPRVDSQRFAGSVPAEWQARVEQNPRDGRGREIRSAPKEVVVTGASGRGMARASPGHRTAHSLRDLPKSPGQPALANIVRHADPIEQAVPKQGPETAVRPPEAGVAAARPPDRIDPGFHRVSSPETEAPRPADEPSTAGLAKAEIPTRGRAVQTAEFSRQSATLRPPAPQPASASAGSLTMEALNPDPANARAAGAELPDETILAARLDAPPAAPLSRAEAPPPGLPTPVHDQIARAARSLGEGQVEIKLSPEELGHVRMTLRPREDGVALLLSADRPETLDLMRRHAGDLVRALNAAGYDSVDLTFTGGETRSGDQRTAATFGADPHDPEGTVPVPAPTTGPPKVAAGGLDLRL